jgi:hypothetical protein
MKNKKLLKKIKPVSNILGLCFLAFVLFQIVPYTSTSSIVKNSSVKQLPSLPGEPVKWVKITSVSEVNNVSHFVEVPKVANNIKISTSTIYKTKTQSSLTKADRIKLSNLSKDRINSEESIALAESIKKQNEKGFFASISRAFSKVGSMFATVGDVDISSEMVTVDLSSVVQEELLPTTEVIVPNINSEQVEQSTDEVVLDVNTKSSSTIVSSTSTEDVSEDLITTTTDITPISTTTVESSGNGPSSKDIKVLDELTSIISTIFTSTTTLNEQAEIATSSVDEKTLEEKSLAEVSQEEQSTSTISGIATTTVLSEQATSTDLVAVEFETPTPVIAEAVTDTGKIVTISATDTLDVPITNVLAFTNIPEIYKVGQEDKIKIKWTNNGDQNVVFKAYDLNNNGKLDYVEWTVSHLSTQTFEIIFISKSFQLDADKEILADIYDTVKTQDDNYAPISDGQYVRVTFEKILTSANDITLYARPASSTPVTIEAYTTDNNQLVATFIIDHEGLYKKLIPELNSSTDVFDLKIIGEVEIDYIVDPTDITLPVITVTSPTDSSTYSTTSININVSATDETSLGNIIPNLDSSLVSWWRMDDINGSTLTDYMGHNNGTITGATQAVGKFGNGINFVGDWSEIIDFGNNSSSNPQHFSMSLWIKPNALQGGGNNYAYLFYKANIYEIAVRPDGIILFNNQVLGDNWTIGGASILFDGGWHNIVFNYDGIAKKVYIDGSLLASRAVTGSIGTNTSNLYLTIGNYGGLIDDTMIFNRALSANEITALYNGTALNYNITLTEGSHTYKAFAQDTAGNVASSSLATFNINLDITAPNISYSYGTPSDSSIQSTTSASVMASTTDASGQHSVFTDWNNSLVGWWKLNGDTTDSSGKNNNGTNYGATPISGKLGGAMSFDGVSDYINIGNFLTSNLSEFTFSVWIKTSSLVRGVPLAWGYGYRYFRIGVGGIIYFTVDDSSSGAAFSETIVTDGEWHHIVGVGKSGDSNIYIDGVKEGNSTKNILWTGSRLIAGAMAGGTASFNGSIDDVQIYNRALSSDEVASLYDASANQYSHTFSNLTEGNYTFKTYAQDIMGNVSSTTARTFSVDSTTPSISVTSPVNNTTYSTSSININASATDTNLGSIIPNLDSSLISWWRMDDVNGSTLTDYMGNNNGTITGASQTTGKFGNALSLVAANSNYVEINKSLDSSLPITWSIWVKSNFADYQNTIFNQGYSPRISSQDYGNEISAYYSSIGECRISLTSTIKDNVWHNLVFIRAGNSFSVFVDGVSNGSTPCNPTGNSGTIQIGKAGGSSSYFNGQIDDTMIYNRALSANEITALYNGTALNYNTTFTEGSHTYKAFAQDTAGNISSSTSSFVVDALAPTVSDNVPSGWQTSNIAVTFTCSDSVSGCSKVYYTTDDSSPSTTTSSYVDSSSSWIFTDSTEGTSTLKYMGIDNTGNLSIATTSINLMKLDKTAPAVTVSTSTMASGTLVTLSCDDGLVGSGCDRVFYTYDGSNPTISSTYVEASTSWQFLISTEGDYDLKYFSKDIAGNLGPHFVDHTRVDRTKPNTTDDFANDNIWVKAVQTISLSPSDPYPSSGLIWTRYCIDQNDTCIPADGTVYSNGVLIENEGTSYFRYASQDRERNLQDTVSRTVKVDTVLPTTSDVASTSQELTYTYGNWTNSDVTITLTPFDATSGIALTTYCTSTVDNICSPSINYSTTSPVVISSNGITYFNYSSVDNAGNIQSTVSRTIKIDKTPPTISNINPADGSNITSGNQITFSLNKVGDCRLALSSMAKSYDQMSEDVSCSVNNGILISCVIPSLGSAGSKSIYLACEDYMGNKDSSTTATHLNYTLSGSGLGSRNINNIENISNAPSSSVYSVAINGGSWTTYDRNVSLQFSTDSSANITGVALSDNPDFSNSFVIPYPSLRNGQHTAEYDLCLGKTTCPDALYNVYAKFLDAQGISSITVSQSITLNAVPLITEIASTTKGIVQNIASSTAKIVSVVLPIKKVTPIYLPPIKTSVPEVAQFSLLNSWRDIIPSSIGKFVFTGLPSDFKNIVNKFPEVSVTLQKIGITKMSDIFKLNSVGNISLANLSEVANIPNGQSMAFADFSSKQKKQIPTDIIFAQTADGSISLNAKLSVSNTGLALQTLNTIQGQPLSFVVKPEGKAKTVQGYMIFKSSKNNSVSSNPSSLFSQSASVLESKLAQAGPTIQGTTIGSDSSVTSNDEVDLVLNKFDYKDSGNGVWTAEIASPLALGQYELRTVIDYTEKTKAPKTISMVVIVDPEGYVYKMNNGEETRISNAQVSIYWQNPKTNIYELWPASNFRQTNPQITDVTGRYAFLVPPGTYKLEVIADSYLDYKGESFKVEEGKGVFINIELKEKMSWLKIINLQNILLGIISIVLIYLAVIFTIRRGKKR